MDRQDAIEEAVQEIEEKERGGHGRSWPRECCLVFFSPQMNGPSVMEGVDGGRAARSQFRFRSMEYGKGQPLWSC